MEGAFKLPPFIFLLYYSNRQQKFLPELECSIKKGSPERGAGTRSVTEGLVCFPAEKFLSEEETTCQSVENVV